jgi:hypothetical protein
MIVSLDYISTRLFALLVNFLVFSILYLYMCKCVYANVMCMSYFVSMSCHVMCV